VDILLVDDTPANLHLLMGMLEGQHYEVRVANSGQRALAAAKSSPPDLVMLDINMPDMDGYEVCRQLKADDATRDVPVIFVSARDEGMDKAKAFTVGGADYVTKPFQLVEVIARIEHQLRISRLRRELEARNAGLARAVDELAEKNAELERTNEELRSSRRAADAIFSALSNTLPGTVLDGRYRLEGKIATGRYGAVYRATHLGMGRAVAVRVLKPAAGAITPESLARFRSEGVAAHRIKHPNAVLLLDFGMASADIPYLVTELLEGRTLAEELEERRVLTLDRCAQVLVPVCDVLAEAHAAGLVHHDVRPANVFLHAAADGEVVKVLDFGLATLGVARGADDADAVYLAPERREGRPYDARADVYSLGVMVYRMLTGDAGEPRPLGEVDPTIPEPVDAIVRQALSPEPGRRPGARDLANQFVMALLAASRRSP
jgi:DNA-binding response OmpR family regulator